MVEKLEQNKNIQINKFKGITFLTLENIYYSENYNTTHIYNLKNIKRIREQNSEKIIICDVNTYYTFKKAIKQKTDIINIQDVTLLYNRFLKTLKHSFFYLNFSEILKSTDKNDKFFILNVVKQLKKHNSLIISNPEIFKKMYYYIFGNLKNKELQFLKRKLRNNFSSFFLKYNHRLNIYNSILNIKNTERGIRTLESRIE